MKKYAYVISYSDESGEWDLDIDLEEERFKYGTIFNYDTKRWEYSYNGDEGYNGRELELSEAVVKAIDYLNSLLKTGE